MRFWPLLAVTACASVGPATHPGASAPPSPPAGAHRSRLVLTCTPVDAEVIRDGVPQGTCEDFGSQDTGLRLAMRSRVEVKKQGFLPWESWVEADGTTIVMRISLTSNGGGTR